MAEVERLKGEQKNQNDGITLSPQNIADLVSKGLQANSPDGKMQAHGKTVKEMKDLHRAQRTGKDTMIAGNGGITLKGEPIMIKECDKHLVHALIEDVQFDSKTGKKKSVARLQNFAPEDFKKMQDSTNPTSENAFRGLSVIIVHDPAKDTEDAVKVPAADAEVGAADGKKLTKNNIHTLSPKKLKEAYQKMFPDEKGNVPPDAMRNQILAKLAAEKTDDI